MTKFISHELSKFIIVGVINTLLTYIIYLISVYFTKYEIAYSISYLCGIIISYYLNTVFVFRTKISLAKFIKFPLVYVFQYFSGLFILSVAIEIFALYEMVAPVVVVILNVPITFLLTRTVLK